MNFTFFCSSFAISLLVEFHTKSDTNLLLLQFQGMELVYPNLAT